MPDAKPFSKEQQLSASRKRYRRIVASRKTWEKLRDERLGPCLICTHVGIKQVGESQLHHVVPRDRFGDDIAENLIPICPAHHEQIEGRRTFSSIMLAEAIQQSEPAVYAYAIDKLGEHGWLHLYGVNFA